MSESTVANGAASVEWAAGNRNAKTVHCSKCNSLILKPNLGVYVSHEKQLPNVFVAGSADLTVKESLSKFIEVDDIFTFENMGFSKDVADAKYLACADCEMGPLGYHDLDTKKSYLSVDRVTFK